MIGTAGLEEPQLIELTTPAPETQVLENPSFRFLAVCFLSNVKLDFEAHSQKNGFYNQRTSVIISQVDVLKAKSWTEKSHAFVKLRKYVTHCGGECNVGHVLRSRTFSR